MSVLENLRLFGILLLVQLARLEASPLDALDKPHLVYALLSLDRVIQLEAEGLPEKLILLPVGLVDSLSDLTLQLGEL